MNSSSRNQEIDLNSIFNTIKKLQEDIESNNELQTARVIGSATLVFDYDKKELVEEQDSIDAFFYKHKSTGITGINADCKKDM